MNIYRSVCRPLLFRMDAERAHTLAVRGGGWATQWAPVRAMLRHLYDASAPELRVDLCNLSFPNPLGLAAGWDKNGLALWLPECLGFGFSEIGSVSADPSAGNPSPRLFRIPEETALVVNYGLPNDGAQAIARRLTTWRANRDHDSRYSSTDAGRPVGVNLVRTHRPRTVPGTTGCDSIESTIDDYVRSAALFCHIADYLTLNLSCPNVQGDGDFFEEPGRLRALLTAMQSLALTCPVFLKVAPRNNPATLEHWLEQAEPFAFVRGFIFNLPRGRPESLRWRADSATAAALPGAVSGRPVAALINDCIREMYVRMPRGRFVIIGAGGIMTAEDAWEKIRLGASLLQLYTALIYEGPSVVRRINEGLARLMSRDGFQNVTEAVGTLH